MSSERAARDIERLLRHVERPSRYIDGEWGARHALDSEYRVALVYPDTYEIGQANQAIAILYEILNGIPGVTAERAYVPWVDMADAMRREGARLATLESGTHLAECDVIGITLPYELTYSNVLEVLDLAGIPLRSLDRDGTAPLVFGGGPCAYNPEPVAPFFDAILIGEGEEAIAEIVATHRLALARGEDRSSVLARLATVPGLYVPSLQRAEGSPPVAKRVVADLSAHRPPTCPVVPFAEVVHDRYAIEVMRGCTRGCRFCQAGMVYRPVRERGPDEIVRDTVAGLACTGYDEVSLTSLSTTDHSVIEEVLRRLTRRLEGTGITVSLPSLRVDSFSVELAGLVAKGRKSGLTFAPEAGSQRLRDVINKNVTEDDLLSTIERAFDAGWRRVKLYYMVGLPTETDDDVRAIGEMVGRVLGVARDAVSQAERGSVRVSVSVSTFVPKAHTPFQWEPQISVEEMRRRQAILLSAMPRKGVEVSWHDPEVSFLEGVMARGDSRLADVIETAWRNGVRFDAWTERFALGTWLAAFDETGIEPCEIAGAPRAREEALPWDSVTCGVSREFLWAERARALKAVTTPDCSFDGCVGCDVCGDLGVEVTLIGARRG